MVEVKKKSDYQYIIEKKDGMNVPVNIFASKKIMDALRQDRALQQGINVSHLPGICRSSIMMPDAHQGYGFPIGGVAAIDYEKGCVSPGGIGFDINCGVRLLAVPLKKEDVEKKTGEILEKMFEYVPCGVGKESSIRLTDEEIDDVLKNGAGWAVRNGYGNKDDLVHCEENGRIKEADPKFVSPRAKARGRKQLGTLGAGNHFLEIQSIEKIFDENTAKRFNLAGKDYVTVMIHCGSRGLGHQVCSDYIKKMETEQPELVRNLPERDLIYAPSGSAIFKDYLKAMAAAANFAWANRHIIAHQVKRAFSEFFDIKEEDIRTVYDVAHNIAKIEEHEVDGKQKKLIVHRKGATRAFPKGRKELPEVYRDIGQPVIIPGSMGTSSYVLVGTEKAMQESFGSTAHGAGRVMSRFKAIKSFKPEQVQEDLSEKKISLKARSLKGISEEAPQVYKDINEVIRVSDKAGIAKPIAKLKPFGVIKG